MMWEVEKIVKGRLCLTSERHNTIVCVLHAGHNKDTENPIDECKIRDLPIRATYLFVKNAL